PVTEDAAEGGRDARAIPGRGFGAAARELQREGAAARRPRSRLSRFVEALRLRRHRRCARADEDRGDRRAAAAGGDERLPAELSAPRSRPRWRRGRARLRPRDESTLKNDLPKVEDSGRVHERGGCVSAMAKPRPPAWLLPLLASGCGGG